MVPNRFEVAIASIVPHGGSPKIEFTRPSSGVSFPMKYFLPLYPRVDTGFVYCPRFDLERSLRGRRERATAMRGLGAACVLGSLLFQVISHLDR